MDTRQPFYSNVRLDIFLPSFQASTCFLFLPITKQTNRVIGRPFRATSSRYARGPARASILFKCDLSRASFTCFLFFTHNKTDESLIGRPFRATFILLVNFFRTPEKFATIPKKHGLINTIYCIFITFLKKINIFY